MRASTELTDEQTERQQNQNGSTCGKWQSLCYDQYRLAMMYTVDIPWLTSRESACSHWNSETRRHVTWTTRLRHSRAWCLITRLRFRTEKRVRSRYRVASAANGIYKYIKIIFIYIAIYIKGWYIYIYTHIYTYIYIVLLPYLLPIRLLFTARASSSSSSDARLPSLWRRDIY
jgi:hypothetical protein